MNNDLLTTTIDLAKKSRVPVHLLCKEIGVSVRWYHKLIAGKFSDPGVRKIERMHKFLLAHHEVLPELVENRSGDRRKQVIA